MVTLERILSPSGVVVDTVEVSSREEIDVYIGKISIAEDVRLRGPRSELKAMGCADAGESFTKCLDYTYDDTTYGAYPID